MNIDEARSPAAKVMDEAIDLSLRGDSPYPERAAFVDVGPDAGNAIERAAQDGRAVVLVSTDGSTHVLLPELSAR